MENILTCNRVASVRCNSVAPAKRNMRNLTLSLFVCFLAVAGCHAQEPPYFVTYSHDLEEPGNLEIAVKDAQGSPKFANPFVSETLELEYGATAWWTTEVYLAGQHTSNDSTLFTGWRWENRFRPLLHEHFINPVLYVEYEHVSEADKGMLEVVGHDSIADFQLTNDQARSEIEKSLELKLILSSKTHGWNLSENFIAEKDLNEPEPWDFGYALGVSRPLALAAYFHNGSKLRFDDVVNFYINSSQLARQGNLRNAPPEFENMSLSPADLDALVAFLKSLTEDYDDA
jgi:hypothetical protein